MWISKKLAASRSEKEAEKGVVATNSNGVIDAGSSGNSRGVICYAPYGYSAQLPVGEEIFLIPCADGEAALGVKSDGGGLSAGEVNISSKGGASLLLRNDGCVVINGSFIINKEGETENGI